MKSYYIDGLTDENLYKKFIRFMLDESDCFSFKYFRFKKNHPLKKSVKDIKDKLSPFQIKKSGNLVSGHRPVTAEDDEYVYDIVFYRSSPEAEQILNAAEDIFEWNYPLNPHDLCFYKDGYMWFESMAEEKFICFSTAEKKHIEQLKNLGLTLERYDDIAE